MLMQSLCFHSYVQIFYAKIQKSGNESVNVAHKMKRTFYHNKFEILVSAAFERCHISKLN